MFKVYKDKKVWFLFLFAIILAIIIFIVKKTFLSFLNSLTIMGFIYLLVGIFYLSWLKGDYTFLSYRKYRDHDFKTYKENLIKQRKKFSNPCLYASFLLIIISFILDFFY